jgi:hypothetical protein
MARTVYLASIVLIAAAPAVAEWTVASGGECVYRWTPNSLLRGPREIVAAPLRPFVIVGQGMILFLPEGLNPALAVGFGAAGFIVLSTVGVVEMPFVVAAGTGDLLTGGYFELGPEPALSFGPFGWMWDRPRGEENCPRPMPPQPPPRAPGPLPADALRP